MKQSKFLYIFTTVIPLVLIVYIILNAVVYISAWVSASKVTDFYNDEVLRIKIYGSTSSVEGNTVSANFAIIDSNHNEIAKIERSWNGAYLSVEFAQVILGDNKYIFPYKIYGKNQINENKKFNEKGTFLEKYYNDYGQCMLLGSNFSLIQRMALYRIAILATKKVPVINFGLLSTLTIDLSNCKTDTYYSIMMDKQGNLFLVEI